MSSGIRVDEIIKVEYQKVMKHDKAYILVKFNEKGDGLEIDEEIEPNSASTGLDKVDFDACVIAHIRDLLTGDYKAETRVIVLDVLESDGDKMGNDRVFVFSWCPDDAKVKAKMLQASSLDTIKKALDLAKIIQLSDMADFDNLEKELKCVGFAKARTVDEGTKNMVLKKKCHKGIDKNADND